MIPLEVQQWFDGSAALLGIVKGRVDETLRHYCDSNKLVYVSRAKECQSVAEKLETGRVQSLREFDDLLGCSVIMPNLSYEDRIIQDLEQMFVPMTIKSRHQTRKDPEVFRFEATRFIGRLRISPADDPSLGSLSFEIQTRTAFEHAWSVATHSPAYKSDEVSWRLERLAAQMKALVEQLDYLAVAYHSSAEVIQPHPCWRTENEARILEWFLNLKRDGWIPEECEPARWGLFAKNTLELIEKADFRGRMQTGDKVDRINTATVAELQRQGRGNFPRTLSLFQFVLGTAIENQIISHRFYRDSYFPPISAALEQLFPRTREITQRCNLSFDAPGAPADHNLA